jgi:type II secretory pathway predicted ATPase ExeA
VALALGQAPRFHHATLIPQVEAALAAEADERGRAVLLAIDFTDRPCACQARPASLLQAA